MTDFQVGNKILLELEKIGADFDYIKYMGDVELTAQLQVRGVKGVLFFPFSSSSNNNKNNNNNDDDDDNKC